MAGDTIVADTAEPVRKIKEGKVISRFVPRNDPALNQKANLIHFAINEDVFHDDDTSIIGGHIAITTPVISTENVVDGDDVEPALSQHDLSTIRLIGVTVESNDSLICQQRSPFRMTHL